MLDAGCQIVERWTTSFDFLRCGRCTVYRPSKYVYVSFNLGVRVERARWRQGARGWDRQGRPRGSVGRQCQCRFVNCQCFGSQRGRPDKRLRSAVIKPVLMEPVLVQKGHERALRSEQRRVLTHAERELIDPISVTGIIPQDHRTTGLGSS